MGQILVDLFEKEFWSKYGCFDLFKIFFGSAELTLPTRDLNLGSSRLLN
jgi:hypothetical protein